MKFIILTALLVGPSQPHTTVQIVVSRNFNSKVIRSEVERDGRWELGRTLLAELKNDYRFEFAKNGYAPFGNGITPYMVVNRKRVDFPKGSFAGSGSATQGMHRVLMKRVAERAEALSDEHIMETARVWGVDFDREVDD